MFAKIINFDLTVFDMPLYARDVARKVISSTSSVFNIHIKTQCFALGICAIHTAYTPMSDRTTIGSTCAGFVGIIAKLTICFASERRILWRSGFDVVSDHYVGETPWANMVISSFLAPIYGVGGA